MRRHILAALLLISLNADATYYTGNQLQQYCRSADYFDSALCMGFIAGVESVGAWYVEGVCVPNGVTVGQLEAVVRKYLADHPETLHHPAEFLTLTALKEAFPCATN